MKLSKESAKQLLSGVNISNFVDLKTTNDMRILNHVARYQPWYVDELLENKNVNDDILDLMARNSNSSCVLLPLSGCRRLPDKTRNYLLANKVSKGVKFINKFYLNKLSVGILNESELKILATYSDDIILLEELSKSKYKSVRSSVAYNENASKEMLMYLLNDSVEVVEWVVYNKKFDIDMAKTILCGDWENCSSTIIEYCLAKIPKESIEDSMIWRILKEFPDIGYVILDFCSQEQLKYIVENKLFLEGSALELITDSDYLRKFNTESNDMLYKLLKSPNTPPDVIDNITSSIFGNNSIIEYILTNYNTWSDYIGVDDEKSFIHEVKIQDEVLAEKILKNTAK